jgi:hypothetical protein
MTDHDITQPHVATIEFEGRRYNVSVRIVFDGIEYVGRLWFSDESWEDQGLPDRGALPGRTRDEVIALAKGSPPPSSPSGTSAPARRSAGSWASAATPRRSSRRSAT